MNHMKPLGTMDGKLWHNKKKNTQPTNYVHILRNWVELKPRVNQSLIIVIMTACDSVSEIKVGIMTIISFEWYKFQFFHVPRIFIVFPSSWLPVTDENSISSVPGGDMMNDSHVGSIYGTQTWSSLCLAMSLPLNVLDNQQAQYCLHI